jgi:hypothetical protein
MSSFLIKLNNNTDSGSSNRLFTAPSNRPMAPSKLTQTIQFNEKKPVVPTFSTPHGTVQIKNSKQKMSRSPHNPLVRRVYVPPSLITSIDPSTQIGEFITKWRTNISKIYGKLASDKSNDIQLEIESKEFASALKCTSKQGCHNVHHSLVEQLQHITRVLSSVPIMLNQESVRLVNNRLLWNVNLQDHLHSPELQKLKGDIQVNIVVYEMNHVRNQNVDFYWNQRPQNP